MFFSDDTAICRLLYTIIENLQTCCFLPLCIVKKMNVVTNIGVLGYEKKQKFLSASLDWCRHCAPVNKGKVDLTGRIFFTFLLDPSRSSLECRLANKVDDGSGDGSLELDVTGVKDPRASGLGGMVLQMPMPRNIVKVAALVVIESPGHAVLGGVVCVVVK